VRADTSFVWRLMPAVRRRERQRFVFFAGLYAVINLGQTVGLVGSEALFLARLGPERLPAAFLLASLATVTGSLLYAAVVGRSRNDRLYVWMLASVGLLLGLPTLLLPVAEGWILLVLFCAFYVSQAVFLNLHYWTFATDYFDTLSSKRLFPLFVAGGSAGGAVGGVLAVVLSRWISTEALIVAWAVMLLLAAGLVQGARRRLRLWLPVDAVEADESSVEGMRGAFEFVRRSQLARWLVLSVVGMVFALFLIQYLYLEIFSLKFESAKALAGFFGIYLALTNGIEIAVSNAVTPWLIRRFGVGRANLVHPATTLLAFAALGLDPALYTAVVARANRDLLENSLADPVRTLSYNALPFRFRGRIRALLEGIVFYGAMSLAGLALLAVGEQVRFGWLCWLGIAAAGLYAAANLRVQREYLRSLVGELRSGRLDIREVGGELADRDLANLAGQWEEVLQQEGEHPSQAVLQLIPVLVRRGFPEVVRKAAAHPSARVRVLSLEALAAVSDQSLPRLVPSALVDVDPQVRGTAARAAASIEGHSDALRRQLSRGLSDADCRVRAACALQLGEEGFGTLRAMASGDDPQAAIEALQCLPSELVGEARQRLDDDRAGVRAAALACVARLSGRRWLSRERLEAELRHGDEGVRREAVRALGSQAGVASATVLATALDDPSRAVRDQATRSLAALGEIGLRAAETALQSDGTWTVDAALSVLAASRGALGRSLLERAFRDQVRAAWRSRVALEWIPDDDALGNRFLRMALEDVGTRSRRLAFRSLELLEDPAVVRSLRNSLNGNAPRVRADALEVLSNLGDRRSAQLLSLLLEDGALEDKIPFVADSVRLPTSLDDVLRQAGASGDRWLLLALAGSAGRDRDEEPIMEGLLALRNVPLFAHLSLHQLEVISRFVSHAQYLSGEVVVREGDRGRSATVLVTRDARLLRLAGERFKELILQAPEIAFEVFRVLTERIRAAEEQMGR